MSTENPTAGTAAATAAAQPAEAPKPEVTTEAAPTAEVKTEEAPKVETPIVEDAATVLKEIEESEASAAANPADKSEPEKTAEQEAKKEEVETKEEPKKLSASALRRQKQKEAREADRARIAEQDAKIARLEAENKALQDGIVDTDTAENYDEAVQTNAVNTALGAQKTAEIEQAKREKATIAQETAIKARNEFAERGREIEGVTDFEDVVFKDDVPFTQDTVAALMEIDNGPAIAYDLATKPERLQELNALSPTQRAIKLGQMSATHSAPKPAIETKAPKPIKPTEDAGGLSTGKPESEMSYAEMRASLGMNVNKPGYKPAS